MRAAAIAVLWAGLVAFSSALHASEWMDWRATAHDETGLPVRWDNGRNIVWKTRLPGPAGSTPIVFSRRVFLTSIDSATGSTVALVLDRRSGAIIKTIKGGRAETLQRGNTSAAPSPATDGTRAYFLFGTGELFATSLDGTIVWRRNLAEEFGSFSIGFGYSSSPVYHDNVLYIQVLQNDEPIRGATPGKRESYIMAIAAKTGKTLWRMLRPNTAKGESKESYTTPVVVEYTGALRHLLVLGADCATSHDLKTGRELGRWTGYNKRHDKYYRIITSPTVGVVDSLMYVCEPRGNGLYALKVPMTGGPLSEAWTYNGALPDVCTPALHGENLYVLSGHKRKMTCLRAKTGQKVWEGDLGGDAVYYASPTIADGRIYMIDTEGQVVVLALGDRFKELARFEMGEAPCHSTIAVSRRQLFVRTAENLYCIGSNR